MKNFILIFCLFCLIGCASVPRAVIKPVAQLEPITIENDNSKLIFISNITLGFRNTTESIGQYKTGTLCVGGTKLYYRPNPESLGQYKNILKENLEKYGYRVTSDLFKEELSAKADILIGARFLGVKANICRSVKGAKGEMYMLVEWEIYDKKTQDIVRIKTEGYGNVPEFDPSGDAGGFHQAFSMATVNMIASEDFNRKAHLDR